MSGNSTTTLTQLKNTTKNTCTNCGVSSASFAVHQDAMTSGQGYCFACAEEVCPLSVEIVPAEDQVNHLIPLNQKASMALAEDGYLTYASLCSATDDELLAVKGIGQATVDDIREEIAIVKDESIALAVLVDDTREEIESVKSED